MLPNNYKSNYNKKINLNKTEKNNFSKVNLSLIKRQWFDMNSYTYDLTFNLVYFFSKYKNLGNLENKTLSKLYFSNFELSLNKIKIKKFKFKFNEMKKNNYWLIRKKFFTKILFFFFLKTFYSIFLKKTFWLKKLKKKTKKKNTSFKSYIKGFLYVWKTKNNFFVTILDYTGNTLITWTGGNTGRTSTKQRSTVFSADSAMYECCYLAKERGLQSVIVHIRSSLWLQQIKYCFEGLIASGLKVDSIIYWPIWAFGGCWPKKLWRV